MKDEFKKIEKADDKINGEIQFNKKTGEIYARLGNCRFKVESVGSSKEQLKNTYFMRTTKGVKENKSEFRFAVESKVSFMPTSMKFDQKQKLMMVGEAAAAHIEKIDKDQIIRDMISSNALKSAEDYTYKTGTKFKKVA